MSEAGSNVTTDREALQLRVRETLARLSRTAERPALPTTATAALGIARDPEADVERLCRVVQADVGLSARLLRVANSAAYARRTPARTLPTAVVTVGLRKTCDLLVAACARQLYGASGGHAERLWGQALAGAIACEELARVTRRAPVDDAFLTGLFRDVGRITFLLSDRPAFEVIEGLVAAGEGERATLETEWYGFDHALAGAVLAEGWGLAAAQCDAIRWHHEPARATVGHALARVVNGADALVHTIGFGADAVPPADPLGLSPEDQASYGERVRAAYDRFRELLG